VADAFSVSFGLFLLLLAPPFFLFPSVVSPSAALASFALLPPLGRPGFLFVASSGFGSSPSF